MDRMALRITSYQSIGWSPSMTLTEHWDGHGWILGTGMSTTRCLHKWASDKTGPVSPACPQACSRNTMQKTAGTEPRSHEGRLPQHPPVTCWWVSYPGRTTSCHMAPVPTLVLMQAWGASWILPLMRNNKASPPTPSIRGPHVGNLASTSNW